MSIILPRFMLSLPAKLFSFNELAFNISNSNKLYPDNMTRYQITYQIKYLCHIEWFSSALGFIPDKIGFNYVKNLPITRSSIDSWQSSYNSCCYGFWLIFISLSNNKIKQFIYVLYSHNFTGYFVICSIGWSEV